MIWQALKYAAVATGVAAGLYATLIGLLTTAWFQTHVVYLHAVQMTWGKNLDVPEVFGFLHNQVTPFSIPSGAETLYAWHILPVGLYRKHEQALLAEEAGHVSNITERLGFRLLREDPDARLIIHFHGAGGTVGSGYRCPNYRALSAGDPDKTHVLTFDYRGYGRSTGWPTEAGVISDAVAVVEWALHVADVPPERIVMYSQSLGTAVNAAVAELYATLPEPIVFAGHILTAPFVDAPTLVSTYSVAGTIPLLAPLARFPMLFEKLRGLLNDKWQSNERIASYVRANEANGKSYRITMIHAEDDYDIPWTHTPQLFWHAVRETQAEQSDFQQLELTKSERRVDLGYAGSAVEWRTGAGVIREEILKYGLHDVVMGNPIVTLAVMRMFDGEVPA